MDRGTSQEAVTFIGRFLKDTKIGSVCASLYFFVLLRASFIGSLDVV